jgi:SAM-dependent methyltransferase
VCVVRTLQACDLCGGTRLKSLYSQQVSSEVPWSLFLERASFPFSISVVLCLDCGWMFKTPGFDQAELERLYSPAGGEASLNDLARAAKLGTCRGLSVLQTLEPFLPTAPLEVLDVGGRSGELMVPLVRRGWSATVVDPSPSEAVFPGISKVCTSFLSLDGRLFGLIVMSHVLEHTDEPTALLEHARTLLEPDGLLFIDVPFELATPLLRRHVGDHRHLGYFSTRTLRAYLLKCGFLVHMCRLMEDVAGTQMPVVRAVARRSSTSGRPRWRPERFMAARSAAEVADPRGLYPRIRNRLKALVQGVSPTEYRRYPASTDRCLSCY